MNKRTKFGIIMKKVEQSVIVRSVRGGLTNMIPVLIIGAFALIFKSFPIDAYQKAINSFAGGFLAELFNLVYSATFGILSIYMTYSISRSYMRLKGRTGTPSIGAVLAEYVETEEQREELHSIGCDCYQGYLYSPAVFLDDK